MAADIFDENDELKLKNALDYYTEIVADKLLLLLLFSSYYYDNFFVIIFAGTPPTIQLSGTS